jgi:hypothetical protein
VVLFPHRLDCLLIVLKIHKRLQEQTADSGTAAQEW